MSDAIDIVEEDGDLPVLTQVLRIGGGRVVSVSGQNATVLEPATESPFDEILLTDQLVIGAEPYQALEPYVPLTTPLSDEPASEDEASAALVDATDAEPEDATLDTAIDESAPVAPSALTSTSAPFDYDAFAVRVREAVLNDLSARIDTEFDARIAQTMWAEVEAALASLQANLREQLTGAMHDVVRRAVEEQVARLRELQDAPHRE